MIDLGNGSSPLINSSKTDPRQYETVHCSNCGSIRFVNEIVLKRVSGLEIGAGDKQMLVPLQILTCANCGTILDDDVKGYKLEDDLKENLNSNYSVLDI